MTRTFVVIPTYNESENIKQLINEILALDIENLHIVVVDDDSPDGTWTIVEEIEKVDDRVHLLHRTENRGRGNAGVAGFKYALESGAANILEMDADFSHDPRFIPIILDKMNEADVVLGSRALPGGEDVGRPAYRRIITKLANLYIRLMFGLKVRDCNSGFRCFKRDVIEAIDLDSTISTGPSIVQEWLYKSHLKGFTIAEVPIVFTERELGASKLGFKGLYKGYIMVLKLKWRHILKKL